MARPSCTLIPAAALLAAVAVAGCGGSSPPRSSGSAGEPSFTTVAADAYRYSACMRAHGIANFPDPKVTNTASTHSITIHPTDSPNAPGVQAAASACRHLMPPSGNSQAQSPAQQRVRKQAMIAFAGCMRSHGFAAFPDPSSDGQLSVQMVMQAGINIAQPAVRQAADACVGVTHGLLTKAKVAQAIAQGLQSGAGG